jgi:hypothetical protein
MSVEDPFQYYRYIHACVCDMMSSVFVTELTFAFLDSRMHVSCPTHRIVRDFITLMIHVAEFVADILLPTSVTPAIYSCLRVKGCDP